MSKVSKLPCILFGIVNDIGKHAMNAQGATGFWDYVKDKLGYKRPKKSVEVEDLNPVDQYPEPNVQQETPFNERWKPGYRGRTDNKRF